MWSDFRQIKKECSNKWVFERLRIPDSRLLAFCKPIRKHGGQQISSCSPLSLHSLFGKKHSHMEISDWKCAVVRNGQFSSGIYSKSRFLLWQSFWAIRDEEMLVKWKGRASFATHPWNETGWPPKLLARFSTWRMELHNDMQESQ